MFLNVIKRVSALRIKHYSIQNKTPETSELAPGVIDLIIQEAIYRISAIASNFCT